MKMKQENFLAELDYIIDRLELIDNQTDWGQIEPGWWLDMMKIKRLCLEIRGHYKQQSK